MAEENEETFEFSVLELDGGSWCWIYSEYPEEGNCGPFATREHAIYDAVLSGGNLVEFMTRDTKPAHRIDLGEVEVSYQVLGYDWPCIYKVHSTGGHAELPFKPPKGLAEGKYRLLLEPLENGDAGA